MSNHSFEATGGGGAGFHGLVIISEEGYYDIVTGGGGTSIYSGSGGNGTAGNSSTIKKNNTLLISAGGGGAATASNRGGTAGTGGTLQNSLDTAYIIVSKNGNNGNTSGKGGYANGASGPISGHTWGESAWSACHYSGGNVGESYHGYVKLIYQGDSLDISGQEMEYKEPGTYTIAIPYKSVIQLNMVGGGAGGAQSYNSINICFYYFSQK